MASPKDEQAAPAFAETKKAVSALYARPRVERLAEAHAALDRLWNALTGTPAPAQAEAQAQIAAAPKPRAVA